MTTQQIELLQGRTYRAKKPACVRSCGMTNDRTVIYIGVTEVQYDGPAVATGRHYPRVTIEKFIEWAGHDVTDELPPGEYASWPPTRKVAHD